MSDDVESGDTRIYKLVQGQSMSWTFRDWKKRRERVNTRSKLSFQRINLGKNLIGVQIDQCDWESIIHIAVDQEGERAYRLSPAFEGIDHRLIVDIHLENHVKTVTFRSGLVLQNTSSQDMQIAIVLKDRRMLTEAIDLKPQQIYNVPILLSYNRWIVVRPSSRYRWSTQMLTWPDLLLPSSPKFIECLPMEDTNDHLLSYKYQINAEFDKKNPLVKQYPFMKIQFCPPVEVENLLPFDFNLTLTDKDTGEKINSFVEKGTVAHIHTMKSNTVIFIQLDLKSDRYKRSEVAIIKTIPNHCSVGEKLVINDQEGVPTNLRMNITRESSTTDTLRISIYAPYLVFNKYSLPISLRQRQLYRQTSVTVDHIPAYSEGECIVPTIFSYSDIDHHNRAQISINESKWSDPISFEAVGNSQDVTLLCKSDAYARHTGIKVEDGTGTLRLTKLITITPRYILKNNMNIKLKFREFGADDVTNIDPNEKTALYQTTKSKVRWLSLQVQELHDNWSAPFDIHEIGKTYVKVDKGDKTIPYLVRVSVHIKDSTIFVTFNQDDEWPYCIVNKSSVDIHFRQEPIELDNYDLKDKQKKSFPEPRRFTLSPGERLKYSWDIPIARQKKLELHVGNRHTSIYFQAIGAQIPFRYMKQRDGPLGSNTLSMDVIAKDSALVLLLTDFELSKSLYRPRSSGSSTLASTSREDSVREAFETVNIQHVINYVFELNLAGFGLSLIDRDAQVITLVYMR
jgi:vacuolar protein sorting-associated protein 13A/C